jgi:predicted O-methyltransferase YrrM
MLKKLFWIVLAVIQLNGDERYLRYRIHPSNSRYETIKTALELMEQRRVKTIVETGTARYGGANFASDGGSTIIYSHYARDHRCQFYSVDINPDSLEVARRAVARALRGIGKNLHFVAQDSVEFLRDFPGQIDFLYLDSYDFDANDPQPSQLHHLREIEAAYPHLTHDTIILIDDCDLPQGGKGKLVIEFLLEKGWKILQSSYQVILVT